MSGGEQRARVKREETEKAVKRSSIPQQKETRVIYIPGQPVNNISTNNDYQVILATVREVVFNFSINGSRKISVEVEKVSSSVNVRDYGVFDLKTKKLISGKFFITSGETYRVHISRYFKGTFVVKAGGKVIGRYTPSLMDANRYNSKPAIWIEPLYIGFDGRKDQINIDSFVQVHNYSSQQWLRNLPQFKEKTLFKPYQPQDVQNTFNSASKGFSKINELAVVMIFKPASNVEWMNPKSLERECSAHELRGIISQQDFNDLIKAIAAYSEPKYAAIFSGVGYLQDNLEMRNILNRKVQVKRIRGFWTIVFKGYNPPFGFTYAGFDKNQLKPLTGGIYIGKKINRVWLSFKNNVLKNVARGTTRGVAGVALAIDIIGDYNKVMLDEKGSRDVMELIGRVGISSVAAGVGFIAGSAALSAVLIALSGATLPIGLVLLIGTAAVMAVGLLISIVSDGLKQKIYG
ncbi:hypothetical protein LVJ85_10485 [Neisseria sp. Dent CA1/247]|uniref:hypothetical protein n=1 Tax=Neisseria sp. Dent CA1/247 TaxID=2912675 RepID=UPI001FCFA52F|nr:hypothetical protein [Neisseria sp. Dent CA1/247]UOO76435.1 hypothetical protein LVJ85_10485 [Neisseria sp. Dent CA1/247]